MTRGFLWLVCSSEEEEFAGTDNEVESEADAPSSEDSKFASDCGSPRIKPSNRQSPSRSRKTRPQRNRRKPRGYSDDEELETDEEEEDEEMGEIFTLIYVMAFRKNRLQTSVSVT